MSLKKSLRSFKKKLHHQSHTYATIRRVYPHLETLSNEEILDYYQVKNLQELEKHIEHIKVVLKNKLKSYKEELKALDTCFCLDAQGDFKYLYPTKKEAEAQIAYSLKTKRIKLTLYPCPYHAGWHLSRI